MSRWIVRASLATLAAVPVAAAAISSTLSQQALNGGGARLAAQLNPLSAQARSTRAAELVVEGRDAEAARWAMAAIDATPMNPDAAAVLGYLKGREAGPEAAEPFMRAASAMSWASESAQFWMLQRASASARFDEAARRADALLRQRVRRDELFLFLRSLTLFPRALRPIAERLGKRPKWRRDFLVELTGISAETAEGHEALLLELGRTSAPPTQEEVNAFASRFSRSGL